MIFRELPPDAAHQAADWQVEARRAELPFIVTVGREFKNLVRRALVPQHMRQRTIDRGAAAAALLVMKSTRIPDACEHETMRNARCSLAIVSEPGDCPNCAGDEQEAIRIVVLTLQDRACQLGRHRDPR